MTTIGKKRRKARIDKANIGVENNPVLAHMRRIAYAPAQIDKHERDQQQAMHDAQEKRERKAANRVKP